MLQYLNIRLSKLYIPGANGISYKLLKAMAIQKICIIDPNVNRTTVCFVGFGRAQLGGQGGRLNIKMPSYQYRDPHVKDYKNPLHIDVVDRYLRRMGIKRFQTRLRRVWNRFIPHESQVSIYHNQGDVDSLSRSPINTNKDVFQG